MKHYAILLLAAVTMGSSGNPMVYGQLTVTSVTPSANRLAVPVTAPIRIDFDRPIDPSTVNSQSLWAFGRWSGTVQGSLSFTSDFRSVYLQPATPFTAGESVTVYLANTLMGADQSTLRQGGFSSQFWTATQHVTSMAHTQIGTLTAGSPSRPYGGIATDLNNDGWLDVTLVNEDSADLRVYLNRADGTGSFANYAQPTYPVGNRASPSEPADFNRDGFADITVANIDDNTLSILLGDGQGGYLPQQVIPVGNTPRGNAVLDFDGDGDVDIVNSNYSAGTMSVHVNNGNGVFGTPSTINPNVTGEWSLVSGDMNNDGMLDLVVASGSASQVQVLTGNGDGTFTPRSVRSTGGRSWMVSIGDLNSDGFLDIGSANAQNNNGAILFGNGDGTLQAPVIYNLANMGGGGNGFPLATDFGDLNGDGHLDWVTASYQGNFLVMLNDGSGQFQFHAEIAAPVAASCSLMFDIDNDGDLDMGLVDELANVMTVHRNDGLRVLAGDFNADGNLDLSDVDLLVAQIASGSGSLVLDLTGDGVLDTADLTQWLVLGGAANLPSGNSYLPGDANLDGTVDGSDFGVWNSHKFSAQAAWSKGDFTADGSVDGSDFGVWNSTKFQSSDAQVAVPEPATALSILVWSFGWVIRRHPKRRSAAALPIQPGAANDPCRIVAWLNNAGLPLVPLVHWPRSGQ